MNLRSLTYFVTVAEELNITRAAKKLNMCQPPLSSQIKSLEDELHTTLFIRGKRHLQLTDAGQLLYRRAKEILSLTDKAEAEILSISDGMSGTISIGLVEGMVPDMAAKWFKGFMSEYPNIRFRIVDGNSDDLIVKLRSGLISLAVITAPYDQSLLNGFFVGKEKISVFLSKDHPLAKKEGTIVTTTELANERLNVPRRKVALDMIYKWFRNAHVEPNIVCEMDSYLDAVSLASHNVGISISPTTSFVPNDSIVVKDLFGDEHHMNYFFVWRKGHPLPSYEESFIDFVKASVEQ